MCYYKNGQALKLYTQIWLNIPTNWFSLLCIFTETWMHVLYIHARAPLIVIRLTIWLTLTQILCQFNRIQKQYIILYNTCAKHHVVVLTSLYLIFLLFYPLINSTTSCWIVFHIDSSHFNLEVKVGQRKKNREQGIAKE